MAAIKLFDHVYSVGVLNPNLRVFDIIMKTDFGTSYNSYLITGEQNILVETCHGKFFDEFIENIRQVIDPAKIDYIILNHTEPDHSGSLADILAICPRAQIICSQSAALFTKEITNLPDLNLRIVKDGDTLDAAGRHFVFINAPFLHWPDSMFTFDQTAKILYSCDFLGAHYCEPRVMDRTITDRRCYDKEFKNYYEAIFGPFKPYVRAGLAKMAPLEAEYVCTSHGPVLSKDGLLPEAVRLYEHWSAEVKNDPLTIPLFYCSAYGNTRRLAEAIAQGILSVIPGAEVQAYNIIENDPGMLGALLNRCDGFLIGSPTLNKDAVAPVWGLLAHIDAINFAKRPCAIFGSYGWSGEADAALRGRLSQLKANVLDESFRVRFVPSDEEIAKAVEYGASFARHYFQK